MDTIDPGTTGRADLEPLAVSPRQACILLGVGLSRLYQILDERDDAAGGDKAA